MDGARVVQPRVRMADAPPPCVPQVFNLTTYPHLVGLFKELGIESEKSDMSFSLSTDDVEWGSLGLSGIFAQKSNLVRPAFLNMIREVIRFGKEAPEVLEENNFAKYYGVTLGQYLESNGYSKFFADNYVVPMCAAIWSCSNKDTMAFPIMTLIRFWVNHHLLNLIERPLWRVVKGRSKAYVDAVCAALPDVRTSTPIESVRRTPNGVVVTETRTGACETYDDVVLACHSDQALSLLGDDASKAEKTALNAIKYQPNEVYLHSDAGLMPRARGAWASWNCLKGSRGTDTDDKSVCVSYWVNLLQNLPKGTPDLFVTLNPPRPPATGTIQHHVTLAHPLFNQAAIQAQEAIKSLQGAGGVWFTGAWCGYGFHEDGIRSAVAVSDLMLKKSSVPWIPRQCDPRLSLTTQIALPLFARVGGSWVPPGRRFKMILPSGGELEMRGKASAAPLGSGVDGKPLKETLTVQVYDQRVFMQSVLRADIGFGESYMNGDFDCDLYALLDMLCSGHPANTGASSGADNGVPSLGYDITGMIGSALHWLGAQMEFAAHAALSNTKEGSKKNIEYHYDAGNAFYKLFLDDTMLYSAGIHQPLSKGRCTVGSALGDIPEDDFAAREKHLEKAQYAKIDAMIARLDLQPGDSVLEIGCGWGTCAIRLASTNPGVRVTGITISNEQYAEARARVKAAGLEDRVQIVMRDYRDVIEVYDKVISIEMLEAVGHEHLPTFFATVSRALRPGGRAAIQVITMPDERYESYCKSESDFIRAYIFPGGHLPSVGAMTGAATPVGLRLDGYDDIGEHYAVTLRLWRERMMTRADTVLGLGYSRKFLRMFEFYFAYCEAGFAHHLINDLQMTWVKDDTVKSNPTADAMKPKRQTTNAAWAGAVAFLCFWVVATLLTSRRVMVSIPFIIGAVLAVEFFTTVAVAAVIAVVYDDQQGHTHSDEVIGQGEKPRTLLTRATRLAAPAVSAATSLLVGTGAAAYVVSEAASSGLFARNGADEAFGKLRNAILAVNTTAASNELAAILVIVAAALAIRRLLGSLFSLRSDVPGVTRSSHEVHVGRDVAVAAACFCAVYFDTCLCFLAAGSVAHLHAAVQSVRELARVSSGFPHGDSALHRATFPLTLLAFGFFRAAPHALALAWTVPKAAAALFEAAPELGRAVFVQGTTVAFALPETGLSGLVDVCSSMWRATAPALPAVAMCVAAVAANVSSVAALAQTIQERRAQAAVRSRIISLSTSAQV